MDRRLLVVLILLALAIPVVMGMYQLQGNDECPYLLAQPMISFELDWSEQDETLVLTHTGGDTLAPGDKHGTVALFVRITDNKTGAVDRVTWFNESVGTPPVGEGDSLTIKQSATTIVLSRGDTVHIWWRGDPDTTPDRCHPLKNYPLWTYNITAYT